MKDQTGLVVVYLPHDDGSVAVRVVSENNDLVTEAKFSAITTTSAPESLS